VTSARRPTPRKPKSAQRIDAALRRDEVVRLALALVPPKTIAAALEVRADTVSKILAEPEIRARIEAARATSLNDGRANLQAATRRLVDRLLELAESRNQAVAVRAIVEGLSKAGFDAPKRIDLGLLAGSTDDELWAKLRELERARTRTSGAEPELPADVDASAADDDGGGEEPSDG
jgi:hypothetical protein